MEIKRRLKGRHTDDVRNLLIVKEIKLLKEVIGLPIRMVIPNPRRRDLVPVRHGARGDDGDVRVRRGDGLEEHGEPVLLVRLPAPGGAGEPVLVADLDEVQFEGLWMAELGAAGAPGGVGGPPDELDLGEGVVDPGLELVFGDYAAVEGEAGVNSDDWERGGVSVCWSGNWRGRSRL